MERGQMLELWNDMWKEGNWVPSWPDSLAGLNAETASWTPEPPCHSIWAEVVHVIYWRQVTLGRMAGAAGPEEAEVAQREFAVPETRTEETWAATVATLRQTHDAIATAIQDATQDVARIPYHLIHDAYHLGRITQLRIMQGVAPTF